MTRFPLLAKVGAIALVGAMVMACLGRIEGLVGERRLRGIEAVQEVERSHAAAQALVGPLLQRTCTEEWVNVSGTEKDHDRVATPAKRTFTLRQAPAGLAVDGRVKADPLHRGLYKINAYVAHVDVEADFANLAPLQAQPEHPDGRLQCDAPRLLVALSDVRGIRSASVRVDDRPLAVQPGTASEAYPHGFSALMPAARVEGDAAAAPLHVKLALELIGTRQLAWVPAADAVRWSLASDWPHPSFGGKFLPDSRSLRADGFGATWNLSALATTASADAIRGGALCAVAPTEVEAAGAGYEGEAVVAAAPPSSDARACLDTMAVSFIDPVNPYVLSDRAVKYALLFVLVTFVAVGLIEVLSGRRVHPVQYLLVGLGLSLFFLLLLSLSEHLPFEQAYGAASLACASLLGFYASAMFRARLAGLAFGLAIGLLYGLLYTLLRMEQNSLAIGSVMLFAGLALVMWLTRRIDWYALFARLRANAEPPLRTQQAEAGK
jgi:inner membrane protein